MKGLCSLLTERLYSGFQSYAHNAYKGFHPKSFKQVSAVHLDSSDADAAKLRHTLVRMAGE